MIEIIAKLIRADSGIYATGEKVECLIEFMHKAVPSTSPDEKYIENLAWASVQLHCYRKTPHSEKSSIATSDLSELIGRTALDAVILTPGDIVVETNPKILFCDLKLLPGENFFNELIPRDGPPTYRGYNIKYFYKITIATQRVKLKVQTLSVPIRVLPIPIIARPDELPGTETNEELAPTNPFLEKKEITELEVSWHHIKNITARRLPKFYRISNKRGFIGRFCLFKAAYKIGEDIVGSLNLANCKVRCIQFSVKLESEEKFLHNSSMTDVGKTETNLPLTDNLLTDNILKTAIRSAETTQKSFSSAMSSEKSVGKITTFSTNHQVCFAMPQTYVAIPIPLHATPSFKTDLVDVSWRLHFEFVTSTMMDLGPIPEMGGEVVTASEVPVETMIWNLPITIFSANPLQIYSPSPSLSLIMK